MKRLEVFSPDGIGEVAAGDDLATMLLAVLGAEDALRDGDIIVVTSKVISKSEGRLTTGPREEALAAETERVVARRGSTAIVRTRLGLTMAAAGIDSSNVPRDQIALLPIDPDASARQLRARLIAATKARVAVIISDTAGRAWRHGQTDIAIGAAGLIVAESHAGRSDAYGNPLVVTLPAVADEIAGAAELAGGKLTERPCAIVRGRPDLVLPADDPGPGAASLVRGEGDDLFGWGAREAVLRSLVADPGDRLPFGAPADRADLVTALSLVLGQDLTARADIGDDDTVSVTVSTEASRTSIAAICFAYGWEVTQAGDQLVVLRSVTEGRRG